jgi:hypothetical protein
MNDNTLIRIKSILLLTFPMIYTIGIIGNMISFQIFSRRRFNNTIFEIYHRYLIIIETLILQYVLFEFIVFSFKIEINSIFECNLINAITDYYIYILSAFASWIMACISLDRSIRVIYPQKFSFKNKKLFQFCICTIIFVFNCIFYVPIFVKNYYSINNYNNDSSGSFNKSIDLTLKMCIEEREDDLIYWMDFFNSTIFPFSIMIISTISILVFVFKSRKRLNRINSDYIKFAIETIVNDVSFLVLSLPLVSYSLLSIYTKFENELINELVYIGTCIFYYLNFAILFYVNYSFNSIFKNEFFLMTYDLLKRLNSNFK